LGGLLPSGTDAVDGRNAPIPLKNLLSGTTSWVLERWSAS
jgi:hypothetical protein